MVLQDNNLLLRQAAAEKTATDAVCSSRKNYLTFVLFIFVKDSSTAHCLLLSTNKPSYYVAADCDGTTTCDLHFRLSVAYSSNIQPVLMSRFENTLVSITLIIDEPLTIFFRI